MSMARIHIVLPAAETQAANDALEALGWGPGNISIPLLSEEGGEVTHYGASGSFNEEERAQLEALILPENLNEDGDDFRSWIAMLGLLYPPETE